MSTNDKIMCNLCNAFFNKYDPLIDHRKRQHERYHKDCKKEGRNTTEGEVIWL